MSITLTTGEPIIDFRVINNKFVNIGSLKRLYVDNTKVPCNIISESDKYFYRATTSNQDPIFVIQIYPNNSHTYNTALDLPSDWYLGIIFRMPYTYTGYLNQWPEFAPLCIKIYRSSSGDHNAYWLSSPIDLVANNKNIIRPADYYYNSSGTPSRIFLEENTSQVFYTDHAWHSAEISYKRSNNTLYYFMNGVLIKTYTPSYQVGSKLNYIYNQLYNIYMSFDIYNLVFVRNECLFTSTHNLPVDEYILNNSRKPNKYIYPIITNYDSKIYYQD